MYDNSVSERIARDTEARSAEARTARLEEMLAGLASTNTYNIPSAKPFKYLNLLTNHSALSTCGPPPSSTTSQAYVSLHL